MSLKYYTNPVRKIALMAAASLCMSTAAQAEEAATPMTGPATNITQTSAQLNATFIKGPSFSTISWGLASQQRYIANCGSLATNPARQSCTASGLTCNTKYAYHALQVTYSEDVIVGKRLYFTTAACK